MFLGPVSLQGGLDRGELSTVHTDIFGLKQPTVDTENIYVFAGLGLRPATVWMSDYNEEMHNDEEMHKEMYTQK